MSAATRATNSLTKIKICGRTETSAALGADERDGRKVLKTGRALVPLP